MNLFNPSFLYGRFQPVCFSTTRHTPSENNLAGMFPPNVQIGSHAKPYGAPNSLTVPSLKRVLFNSIYINVLLEIVVFGKKVDETPK
jgi:hypothetical protein